ncbi:MAG: hypothetical protein ABGW55_00080 [Nitrosopumilus sp.]
MNFYDLRTYVLDDSLVVVTVIFVPIRPSRRDPEVEEIEDSEY